MRMIAATLVVLALVAAKPALAGCGSHGGGGYSGGYRARVVRSPIVVKKVVQKPAPQSSVRTAAATTADKPEATAQVVGSTSSTGTAVAESSPAKTTAKTPQIECKEYSAAVGEMITVPCS
jgi:hypothetical protein